VRWRNALVFGVTLTLLSGTAAQAATELSTSDRLQDRREVAAGTRAYAIGFEDGRFYANGWHITGEMGGVWTPPLKLLDGLWFGVDDQWAGQATKFTSGRGYTRYDLPPLSGLNLRRTDFVPDGRRAALFGLELTNPTGAAKTVTVKVDARSELMTSYPWGWSSNGPTAGDNLPDSGSFDGNALVFRDQGALPGAETHDYSALVASTVKPDSGAIGSGFWGAQPGTKCAGDSQAMPSGCDDGPYGNGTGGELRYTITVPAGRSQTVWVAAAGSDQGLPAAKDELARALRDPGRQLAEKAGARAALARWSRVTLPGDTLLQDAVDWGKQNLADLTQTAENLKIRFTNQATAYPAPKGTVARATWIGAGYPDYPWLFATDGEYTAFASVALGQFEGIEDHLRALRDVSEILNDRSGKVAHEVVQDGSVYFGANSDPGNTDETVKFPSTVALIWRWTGDDRFRDDLYDFSKRNLQYVLKTWDVDGDGWPEGSGNVERTGMGEEKLDNTVYFIRGLYDLADMARSKHDRATQQWATGLADKLRAKFEGAWWNAAATQYADSLKNPNNDQLVQQYWIGVTPMEAELNVDGQTVPGVAAYDHGVAALATRESACYSGTRPYNRGLFHTGCAGPPNGTGEKVIFSLNTAIQAVGEGNYGRLGAEQQQRYTDADAETMFSEPAAGGEPDEQPGAMPEILPSPDFGNAPNGTDDKNIDRCWSCRSMFMQAWGNYGTAWPVIHQQLGVRPALGYGRLDVVPQVPDGQPSVQGDNIRLGDGSASVFAARDGGRYTTKVAVDDIHLRDLVLGATLPSDARVAAVYLDGKRVKHYDARATNRGLEVTTEANGKGWHSLTVVSR
jgi:hypothetical protein